MQVKKTATQSDKYLELLRWRELIKEVSPEETFACILKYGVNRIKIIELVESLAENWCWRELSASKKLPWSIQLIADFEEKWDWNVLSKNPSLPWDSPLIERFIKKWHWGYLSSNIGYPRFLLFNKDLFEVVAYYLKGTHIESSGVKNIKTLETLEWYEKVATAGYADAQFVLAEKYANAQGVQKDHAKALALYMKAASQGFALAQFRIAQMYEKGEEVAQDFVITKAFYEKAAKQGLVRACFKLVNMYKHGIGVEKNSTKVENWESQIAKLMLGNQHVFFGARYYRGKEVEPDYLQAIKHFEKAAAIGHADAQFNLGVMYEKGIGVIKDQTKADQLYEESFKSNWREVYLDVRIRVC